jgi:acyl-CoA thioesterase
LAQFSLFRSTMNTEKLAEDIVMRMMRDDAFSKWLGMEIVEIAPGRCILQMNVRAEMLNGFGIAHGGISYALADSALAFASNSHGRKALSVETSISHTQAVQEGDLLTATAEEEHLGEKIGIYRIRVSNRSGKTVALFKGVVYRTGREWATDQS